MNLQSTSPVKDIAVSQPTTINNKSAQQNNKPALFMRWILMLLLMTSFGASAQITVSGSLGSKDGTYASLTGAGVNPNAGGGVFAALNSVAQTGATITVSITGDCAEAGTNSLNAGAWTTITISPSGGATRTISGTLVGAGLLTFNGADNVTINGLNTGGDALIISNLSTSATTLTSTIRYLGGATGNTITNCSVLGSSTMAVGTNGGNIFFHTDANTANGNDNNTISNNIIGPAGANLPSKGVYGNGSTTTTAIGNSGNIITNNNFENIFGVAVSSAGIYCNDGCNNWTVTNNRFYQTATRTWTTGASHYPIWIIGTSATSGAQGFTITGNIIGYASNTQTGIYTLTGTGASARFWGIYFNGSATGTTTTVSNNTIASVSMTGVTGSGTGNSSPFMAINLQEGLFVSNGNTIGSQSATGSLTFSTTTTSSSDVYGIQNFSSGTWTSNNNNIGGISVTNLGASGTFLLWGMKANTGTGVTWTANNNNIGGTVANSIQLTATGTSSQVMGLQSLNAPASFTSNTIRNLTTNIGTGTTTGASVIGICLTSSTPANTLTQNTIFNLSNTNATAASVVTGIQYTGSAGTNNVTRNNIYGLSVSSTSSTAEINGIRIAGGTTTYANNMIALGTGVINANIINGINEPSGTDIFYHNSVYIGGSPTAGSGNSFAFNSTVTTNTRNFRNNIFVNARSNGAATGKNYAVQVGGTAPNPAGLTINYNVYNAPGTGGVFGRFNSLDVINLTAWKSAVGQDANSAAGDPQYQDPANATPDLHINPAIATPVEGAGVVVSTTDDFDGQTRSGLTPTDIGADAGNFTSLPNCTGTPASATINGAAAVCTGTGTTLTLSTVYTDLGITYQWRSATVSGGPYSTTLGTAASQATGNLTTTTYYIAEITCSFTGLTFTTAEKSVVVNALPTVLVSPTSGTYCTPGGTAVALAASGASTYTWSPTTGLTPTTGANVNASPSVATTYTVTGTDANGCVNTATSAISVANAVTISSTTATPSTICSGGTSTLNVSATIANSAYSVAAIGSPALLTPGASPTTTLSGAASFPVNTNGTAGDDSYSAAITIPFSFGYNGGSITQLWVSTNGYLTFTNPVSVGASAQRTPQTLPSATAPNNVVAAFWHDMDMRTAGNVRYYTIGSTPNRQMVIEFNAIPSFTGGLLHTGQIVLYEAGGTVDVVISASAVATKTLGVENTGGTAGVAGTGRNNVSWTVSTIEGWQFTLPAATYAWEPSGDVVSPTSQSTLTNALTTTTTFTVTATSGGCSATGTATVTISAGAAIVTDPSNTTKCAGETATFTVVASGPGLTYQWRKGGIDIPIGGNASAGTATLSLPNVSAADIDTYDVVVSSSCGSPVTSAGATLGVTTSLASINAPVTTICSGNPVTLTENGGTATSWSWAPGGATTQSIIVSPSVTTTYTVTATLNGCNATASQTITVNPTPSAVVITPASATICEGGSVGLVVTGGTTPAISTLGAGTSTTTPSTTASTLGPNPIQSYYGGAKQQMIILASELTTLGLVNGSVINSVAFNLAVAETGRTLQNLQVKVSNTALSAFAGTTFAAAGTVVRNAANFSVAAGWNTIAFDNSFTWNGTSNIIIEVNFSNNDGGGTGTSTAVYSTTAFASTLFYRNDSETAAVIDAKTTASFAAYTQRNNMQIGFAAQAAITWSPNGDLTPNSGPSVSAAPASTTTYTVTSTLNGCSSSNTVTVTVNPNYTITASAGPNGSISPNGITTLSCDGTGDQTYTITPDACYSVADVLVDGVSIGAVTSHTFTDVTANHTIAASFSLNGPYTITVTAGANGSITPGTGSVNCGDNATYTITPDACYSIADVVVDGVSQGAITSHTFTNVQANHTISATFTLNTFTITVTAGANGSITPGTGSVNCGDNATYTITPNACYSIADVVVDGVSQGAITSHTFTNVQANHTISATFVLTTYTITVTAGANGSITPGTGSVNCGDNATYTITPNACYSIADVVVDGVSQGAITSHTFTNVQANHTISATFTLNTFTITVTAGANGSITPGTGSVNCGDNATYTISPDACFAIADVIVDGVSQGAITSHTFTNVQANHTISATFIETVYTITVTAGANGSITPGTGTVNCGANATYTITPDACYSIADVIVDGVSQGAITSHTFTNVQANHTISASFVQITYTITVTAGANGSITPGTGSVNCGDNATYTITPDACYSIADVVVDGVSQGAITSHTFTNVQANHTISATFTLNTYTITVTAGANGSITPGTGSVNCGDNATYTITPDACYAIVDVIVDGVSQGAITSHTFTNVQANHTISATFAPTTYTITVTAGANGSITPGTGSVNCGDNATYTITPDACYVINEVVVDGVSAGTVGTYTFTNVQANHTISATFVLATYTITVSNGPNGSINPQSIVKSCGSNQTFTMIPDDCYSVADVVVDGVSQGAVGTYTFTNITAAHTISATFVLNTYTITVTAGANGSITPGTGSVNCGANATYTITPDACYSIADVIVDGVSQGAITSHTFTNVTANHTISATFALTTYTITVTAGANGSITPGTGSVNCGDNATYTITPDACYSIADVIVDGVSQGAITSHTFTNVQANHTISATFVQITYTITVTAGANGSITPGTGSVNCGANATYTITPDACYSIADVIVDGVSQGAITSHTFTNVQANHTISATFVQITYTITVTAGANGSITPGTGSVNCGANATYTITPDPGYAIADVIVDGVSQGAITSHTFTNVQANHTISATFVLSGGGPFTINSSAGAGGSISPNGATLVNQGDNQTYTITANACFSISDVIVDGVSQGAIGTYTFTNVQANHTISASFTQNGPYTITATSGPNGSVTPLGATIVTCGANQSYNITPIACYHVLDVLVDGVSVGAVTTYTFTNVQANHTISATFAINASLIAPVVTGPVNICQYIGTLDPVVYTASSAGATGYSWIVPPNTVIVSGQGTSTLTVTFQFFNPAQANKQIRVTALSPCGNSPLTIYYLAAQVPNTPGPITASSNNVCAVIGTPGTITYTINSVPGASTYNWSAQGGTTTINHPNGPGVNDTTVTVSFTMGFTSSNITVFASNAGCGQGGSRSLLITRANPSTPGLISGPTNACPYMAPGGVPATYSVTNTPGNTYTWSVPSGAIGLTGQGTSTISFTYPNTFVSGSVTVFATNGCGSSGTRSLSISKLNPATPSVIDVIQTQPCPNRVYTYTLASMPANATSVQWTVPVGATLVSGQGTTSITVSYPPTSFNSAVTAQAFNNCGSSSIRSTPVKIPSCPGERSIAKGGAEITTPAQTLQVNVYPNPTVSDFKLQVLSAGKQTINVRILDMQGREYKKITVLPYQTTNIGAELKAGAYFMEVRQGNEVKTVKLMKF